ncbi:MAG: hypothetical protein K2L68_02405 [Muribaculaceae bacterium]|nr:hypothetical protein [Muribaculaceae bacterium]
MDIVSILSQRINLPDIRRIATSCVENEENREILWQSVLSDDRTVSINALWVLTHFDSSHRNWIVARRNELTDILIEATDAAKKRMLLQLLRNMEYEPDDIRTDLLDFCLYKINSECEPYSIRAFCIYLAFKLCRHYPELVAELEGHLTMLTQQTMSPGLVCSRNKTIKAIERLR